MAVTYTNAHAQAPTSHSFVAVTPQTEVGPVMSAANKLWSQLILLMIIHRETQL